MFGARTAHSPSEFLVGQLHHRRQLLVGEAAVHRHRRDRRQRLQRPRRFDLVAHHVGRFTLRSDRAVDLAAVVEHPQHHHLARPQVSLRDQPSSRSRAATTPWNESATRRPARRTCTDPTTGGMTLIAQLPASAGRRATQRPRRRAGGPVTRTDLDRRGNRRSRRPPSNARSLLDDRAGADDAARAEHAAVAHDRARLDDRSGADVTAVDHGARVR